MKISPKTDQQIVQENLWPEGEYDFEVAAAEETTSKKGNPMIKVTLVCFDADRKRTITDYLLESMAFKLKHFLYTIGMGAGYESGEFTADQMVGRAGKVILKHEQQEGFMPKNVVKDYISPTEADVAKPKPIGGGKSFVAVAGNDEPPFARHEDRSW